MHSVNLIGAHTQFGRHLRLRLERVGVVCDDSTALKIVCWTSGAAEDCDLAIRPTQSDEYPATSRCELVLHDLYIPEGAGDWGPNDIENILAALPSDSGVDDADEGAARHWIHVRDVVDAVADMLPDIPEGTIHVCGRRPWSHRVLRNELEMLYNRVVAAKSQTFQLENLIPLDIPVQLDDQTDRPDLTPLHSALLRIRGEGWHPLTPLRLGLMECIAHRLDSQQ